MDSIDWRAAQRIGELIAGSPPLGGDAAPRAVEPLRARLRARASAPTAACRCPSELPPLEAVDRPAWIAANLRTMRPLLGAR